MKDIGLKYKCKIRRKFVW